MIKKRIKCSQMIKKDKVFTNDKNKVFTIKK